MSWRRRSAARRRAFAESRHDCSLCSVLHRALGGGRETQVEHPLVSIRLGRVESLLEAACPVRRPRVRAVLERGDEPARFSRQRVWNSKYDKRCPQYVVRFSRAWGRNATDPGLRFQRVRGHAGEAAQSIFTAWLLAAAASFSGALLSGLGVILPGGFVNRAHRRNMDRCGPCFRRAVLLHPEACDVGRAPRRSRGLEAGKPAAARRRTGTANPSGSGHWGRKGCRRE